MPWFSKKRPAEPDLVERRPDEPDLAFFSRLAGAHLDAETAERWLALGRPAIHLVPAAGGPVLARLGGRPVVPADFVWPVWDGHGPLTFIAEVDLAAVAASGLDAGRPLPPSGRLLAFYFDGSYDDFQSIVGSWDPESAAGARILYVADDRAAGTSTAPPDRVEEFTEVLLGGAQILTFPNWEHPALRAAFDATEDGRAWMDHPVNADVFAESVYEAHVGPRHQLGGWPEPVQGPVEYEVAPAEADDAEVARWRSLLQVDSDDDAGMMWGDVGTLYWLTRDEDAPAAPLGPTGFTWQCS